jgi:hypothetical protein
MDIPIAFTRDQRPAQTPRSGDNNGLLFKAATFEPNQLLASMIARILATLKKSCCFWESRPCMIPVASTS